MHGERRPYGRRSRDTPVWTVPLLGEAPDNEDQPGVDGLGAAVAVRHRVVLGLGRVADDRREARHLTVGLTRVVGVRRVLGLGADDGAAGAAAGLTGRLDLDDALGVALVRAADERAAADARGLRAGLGVRCVVVGGLI